MRAPDRTRPPQDGNPVVLYDAHCDFCTLQARRLDRHARGRLTLRSFHDDGVLDDYPGLSREECMREMKMIDAEGRVSGGAEAVARALSAGNPLFRGLLWIYFVPGVRWIADRVYAWVARNRTRMLRAHDPRCKAGGCRHHQAPLER